MKRRILLFVFSFFSVFCTTISAQVVRPYGLIFSDNLKGGHTMFGNTSMAQSATTMNYFQIQSNGQTSTYGNDDANMQFVDVDGTIGATSFISYNEPWYYHDQANKPASWPKVTALTKGPKATPLYYKSSNTNNMPAQITHYFVKQVSITNPAAFANFTLEVTYESGFVVYVNGTEAARYNINAANPAYNTYANSQSDGTRTFTLSSSSFISGTNTIQVEMHRSSGSSSSYDDINFNLKLSGNPVNTVNSSQADLILPVGTNTIKFARLYWGGKYSNGAFTDAQLKSVKIRKGTSGAYGVINAANVDKATAGNRVAYQSYADITSFVKSNGVGTYTIADISATPGAYGDGGAYAGWSIVIAYENPAQPYRSVRIYDGYLEIEDNATKSITLTGLDVPNNTLTLPDAYMSTMAWEGDGNLAATCQDVWDWSKWQWVKDCNDGDFIKVNGNMVSNGVNPATNMWNGTISKNGQHVTTKLPDYKNQMGIDIDEIQVGTGYGINPGATSATIEFGTEADQYFPSLFAFSIVMKNPAITIQNSVQDINGDKLAKGDFLYYTLQGSNTGVGMAYNTTITDNLPPQISFVPGSLQIWNGSTWITYNSFSITGNNLIVNVGSGATASMGGTLLSGQTYKFRFKAQVNQVATIVNVASIMVRNTPLGSAAFQVYADESSAEIGFDEVPLPVTFKSFSGSIKSNLSALQWATVTEENAKHFEIERSFDARNFHHVASVSAHGSSTEVHTYQHTDAVTGYGSVGTVYYRLKIVDFDGKVTFSKVIALKLDGSNAAQKFALYPNPLHSGHDLKLQLQASREQNILIQVISNSGQVAVSLRKNVQPGNNIVVLNEVGGLVPGAYTILVIVDGQRLAQNILKQ